MNRRHFVCNGSLALATNMWMAPVTFAAGLHSLDRFVADEDVRHPAFLENKHVKIGVDLDSGGGIFHFSERTPARNLLNHHDTGRFIQQSYYGDKDGSMWSGKPWRWNPVQGGGTNGQRAKVLDSVVSSAGIYVKTEPRLWATGAEEPDAIMEEWLTLQDNLAHIRFKFTYAGAKSNEATTQELPAVFMDYDLSNLVHYSGSEPWINAPLTRSVPGWPNQPVRADENWAAYVDDMDWGLGVYFPGSTAMTTYRFHGPAQLTAGPMGNACSYFAPTQKLAITHGWTHEYDIWLTIGKTSEIRERFYTLHAKLSV